VYDKTVRRRRAVLGLLVVLSIILLTGYFGESAGGGLHSIQRGFVTVIAPIQDGAHTALKPFRDFFGWIGDTINAKGQRDSLRKQLATLRAQRIADAGGARQAAQLEALLGLDTRLKLSAYHPVSANVIGRSPTVWYAQIEVDRGSADGVRTDQPVIDADGLVGKVTTVTPHASFVTLITDQKSGVSATDNETGAPGVVQPAVGNPNDLLMQFVPNANQVKVGQEVVTSGTISGRLDSLFPGGIPIGKITSVDPSNLLQGVHIQPFANLRSVEFVQILMNAAGAPPAATAGAVAKR
jgi:rod shape-determining protein MreC